jgi:hypothetical protein
VRLFFFLSTLCSLLFELEKTIAEFDRIRTKKSSAECGRRQRTWPPIAWRGQGASKERAGGRARGPHGTTSSLAAAPLLRLFFFFFCLFSILTADIRHDAVPPGRQHGAGHPRLAERRHGAQGKRKKERERRCFLSLFFFGVPKGKKKEEK